MSNGKGGRKKLLSTVITVVILIIASVLGIDVSNILETDSSNNQNQTETKVFQFAKIATLHFIFWTS